MASTIKFRNVMQFKYRMWRRKKANFKITFMELEPSITNQEQDHGIILDTGQRCQLICNNSEKHKNPC